MKLLPKMGGVISIWFASTLLGAKYFNTIGIFVALLSLLSVNPLMNFKRELIVFPFSLTTLCLYIAVMNPEAIIFLIFYLILFASLKLTDDRRVKTRIGAFALTFPFPMMALSAGEGLMSILHPLALLLTITAFNLYLAESRIYGNNPSVRFLALPPLAAVFLLLTPPMVSIPVIAAATIVTVASPLLSLRRFGFSLLSLHLIFVLSFLILAES